MKPLPDFTRRLYHFTKSMTVLHSDSRLWIVTETNHVCPCMIHSKIVTWRSPDFHSVASFSPSHVTSSILQTSSKWIRTFWFACKKKPIKTLRGLAISRTNNPSNSCYCGILLCHILMETFYQISRVPALIPHLRVITHHHIPWESNPFPLTEKNKYTTAVVETNWTPSCPSLSLFCPQKQEKPAPLPVPCDHSWLGTGN